MGGVPGILLTHHYTKQGSDVYHLDAFCVRKGRVFEIYFADLAGHEPDDHALLVAILATFTFTTS